MINISNDEEKLHLSHHRSKMQRIIDLREAPSQHTTLEVALLHF